MRRWAVLCVLVLVAHLALMASPLHRSPEAAHQVDSAASVAVVHPPEQHALSAGSVAPPVSGPPKVAAQATGVGALMHADHFHDCAMETVPPSSPVRLVHVDGVTTRLDAALGNLVASCEQRGSPRPPLPRDVQALLQVFRL